MSPAQNVTYFQAAIANARAAVAAEIPNDQDWGKPKRTTAMALAWIEEVNAEYNLIYDQASPAVRAEIDLAKKLCRDEHDIAENDDNGRLVTMGHAGPAMVCKIPGSDFTRPDAHVVCVTTCMGGARPLWTHYWNKAREILYMTPVEREEALRIAGEQKGQSA